MGICTWPGIIYSFYDLDKLTAMETPFTIVFTLNLNGSGKIMKLQGEASLHHSIPHYLIRRINRLGQNNGPDILPDVDLKCIIAEGKYKWVHSDSGKETYLSQAIGLAIENAGQQPVVADPDTDQPDDEPEQG